MNGGVASSEKPSPDNPASSSLLGNDPQQHEANHDAKRPYELDSAMRSELDSAMRSELDSTTRSELAARAGRNHTYF